jgi:hypothetical protein
MIPPPASAVAANDPGDDRGDRPAHGGGVRRAGLPVGEEQVPGADQRRRDAVDVGVLGDAAEVYRRSLPDQLAELATTDPMTAYETMCGTAADGMRQAGPFGAPERWRFDWEQRYSRAEWLDVLPTQGAYTLLPKPTLAAVLAGVGEVIDDLGGDLTGHYTTVVVTAAVR